MSESEDWRERVRYAAGHLASSEESEDPAAAWSAELAWEIFEELLAAAWEQGAANGSRGLLPQAKRDERNPYRNLGSA